MNSNMKSTLKIKKEIPEMSNSSSAPQFTSMKEEMNDPDLDSSCTDFSDGTSFDESQSKTELQAYSENSDKFPQLSIPDKYRITGKEISGKKISNKRRLQCEHCLKWYCHKTSLVNHLRLHTGERPFRCDICCKTFTQKQCLIVHIRTHTGERPYKCQECGKRFQSNGNLFTHKRIHSGEKLFHCEQCDRSFTQKKTLWVHLNSYAHKLFNCHSKSSQSDYASKFWRPWC